MNDNRKNKEQLVQELDERQRRINKMEAGEIKVKKSTSALKESEIRFRNIFESSKDGIIFFDGKTRKILLGNSTMAELLECSKKALVGRSISSLHPAEDWTWVEQEFQKHVTGEVSISEGIPVLRNDGSVFYADIRSSIITLDKRTYFSAFFRDITERKQAEEALKETREQYRSLASAEDPMYLVDRKSRFLFMNDAHLARLGLSLDKVIGKYYGDFHSLEDTQRFKAPLEKTFRTNRSCQVEHFSERDHKYFLRTFSPVRDAQGSMTAVTVISKDITDRKRAEEALRESEARYRSLFENSDDAVLLTAPDGRIFQANASACRLFGRTEAEIIHLGRKGVVDETDPRLPVLLEERKRTGRTRGELTYKRRDGQRFPGEMTSVVFPTKDGLRTCMIIRDITERKRAEEALHQAEEKYRSIVENAVEGIFQSTSDGKFIMANSAVAKFFGYDSPEELMTAISNFGEQLYVHLEERQRYRQLMADEGMVKGFETQFYRKDSTINWGSMNVRSVRDNEGRIPYYEGTIEDITARKKAEERLQKSLEKLRKAMGGIIQAMSLTVETRDPYTAGHQRRVADLSRAIAQEMGLPEDQVDALRMAGTVHDLGKIAIPAEILSKPVQLSDIEFSLIKGHPQISYDILKDIDFNWPVAQIVLQHHERINGSGYPNGLAGKAIYLEARILAVADVVEAISSYRPYRLSYGIDMALEEIEKNKGILYDPETVEVCLSLFREKGFGFEYTGKRWS